MPKRGDLSQPNNYRPITLNSVFSKIYTMNLNQRLLNWAEDHDVLITNQFGFRAKKSTVDAVFILHGIISHTLGHKKKLYAAFVDFCKAFDRVDRRILWYKLMCSGVSSKFVSVIKNIYSVVNLCIRCDKTVSQSFVNSVGVKQGDALSPLLFLFFINDIAQEFNSNQYNEDQYFSLNGNLLYLFLFADDTVLFAKSPDALQILLDKLKYYCSKWNIEVNKDKTEVLVFRNSWQQTQHKWYYDNQELNIVNSYVYLGVLLNYNGKFQATQKRFASQGGKALSSVLNTLKNLYITPKQQCYMFDSLVSSVLNYASELWGFHQAKDIEQIHYRFCRFVLKVPKSTPLSCLVGDLGHLPMYILRKQKILKYWLKIILYKPDIVYDIYSLLVRDCNDGKVNWASNVRDLLFELGYNNLWYNQDNVDICYDILNRRLLDQYYQSWYASITDSEKLHIYRSIKTEFVLEEYLLYNTNVKLLSHLRFGILKLNVETGRYYNINREDRLCKCCSMKNVENEYHFMLVCPAYRQIRLKYFTKYYCSWPSMNKLYALLKSKSEKFIYKICCYIRESWALRSHILL